MSDQQRLRDSIANVLMLAGNDCSIQIGRAKAFRHGGAYYAERWRGHGRWSCRVTDRCDTAADAATLVLDGD